METSRLALGPTQYTVQQISGALSPGVGCQGLEADHLVSKFISAAVPLLGLHQEHLYLAHPQVIVLVQSFIRFVYLERSD